MWKNPNRKGLTELKNSVRPFWYAGHGIYLGGESPLWGRCRNCQPLANIKGVHREVESERRWR